MMHFSLTRRLICGLVAACALCALPPAASAGTFNVGVCNSAGDANNAWALDTTPTAMFASANNCASGGSSLPSGVDTRNALVLQSVAGQTAASATGAYVFTAPSGLTITALSYNRHLQVFNDDFWRVSSKTDDGELEGCQLAASTSVCNVWATGGTSSVTFSGLNTNWLRIGAACSTACDGGGAAASASIAIYSALVTLSDPTNPTANALTGSLAGGANLTGSHSLTVAGSDLTGIKRVEFLIDGNLVSSANNANCNYSFTRPCAQLSPSFSSTFSVNTAALAHGSHSLTGRVYDAANNMTVTSSSFSVKNLVVTPPAQVGTPPPAPTPTPPVVTPRNSYIRVTSSSLKRGTLKVGGLIHSQASGRITVKVSYRDSKRKLRSKTYTATKRGQKWSISKRLTVTKASISVKFAGNAPWISTSVVKSLTVKKSRSSKKKR